MDPAHNPSGSSNADSCPPVPNYKWFQTSVIDSGLTAIHSKLYNTQPPPAPSAYKKLMRTRKTPVQLPAHEKHMASRLFPHARPSTMTIIVGGTLPFANDSSRSAGSRKYHVPIELLYKHTSITVFTTTFDSTSSTSDDEDDEDTPPAYLTLPKVLPSTFQNLVDYMHSNIYSINTHNSDYHPIQSHMRAYLLGVCVGATSFANAALRSLCKVIKPGPRLTYRTGIPIARWPSKGIATAPFRAADMEFVCEGEEASEEDVAAAKTRLKAVMFDAVAAWLTISEVFGFEKEGGYPTVIFDPWKSSSPPPSTISTGSSFTPINPPPPPPPSTQPATSNESDTADSVASEQPNLPRAYPPLPSQQRERALWTHLYATHDDFRARLQSSFRVPDMARGGLFRDEEDYVKGIVVWKENVPSAPPIIPPLQRENAAVGDRGRQSTIKRRREWFSRRVQRHRNVGSSEGGATTGPGASANASCEEHVSEPPGLTTATTATDASGLEESGWPDADEDDTWMMYHDA